MKNHAPNACLASSSECEVIRELRYMWSALPVR